MFKDYGRTNYITGLRAIAATMVLVIHTGALMPFGTIGENITLSGLGGVYIFFVIAGFSVAASFEKEHSFGTYIRRRLIRVIPSYFLAILATVFLIHSGWIGVSEPLKVSDYDFYNVAMHLAFISYFDASIANSILFVEWTLPIEVFWYFALPFIFVHSSSFKRLVFWLLFMIVLAEATSLLLSLFEIPSSQIYAKWLPTKFGYYFMFGVIAYKAAPEIRSRWPQALNLLLASGLIMFVLNVVFSVGNTPKFMGIATFLVLCGYNSQWSLLVTLLENKVMLFLGGISYGLYLVHFPIVRLLRTADLPGSGPIGFSIVFVLSIATAYLLTIGVDAPIAKATKNIAKGKKLAKT